MEDVTMTTTSEQYRADEALNAKYLIACENDPARALELRDAAKAALRRLRIADGLPADEPRYGGRAMTMTTTESATRRCGQQYAAGLVNRWCDLPRFHPGFHSGRLEHTIRREYKTVRETAGGMDATVLLVRDTCACGWRSCWYRESVNAAAASARHLCECVGDGAAR